MPQVNAHARRRWRLLGGVMLLALLVAGCGGASDGANRSAAQDDALPVTERLARYHDSLRAEADWLWENMLHAQSHPLPDEARCQRPDFDHQPVMLNETERQQDSAVGTLEQLDYADLLLTQARAEWQKYCQGEQPGANAAAYLQSRLEPAFGALDLARSVIEARRESEARGR